MKVFLRLKHWFFFLFLFVPVYFVKDKISLISFGVENLTVFSLWFYSIGRFGQKKLLEYNLKNEKVLFLTISCFLLPIGWLIPVLNPAEMLKLSPEPMWLRITVLTISFLFIIVGYYLIYFTAKTIKTMELKTTPKFKNMILIMLGILFWPIGIWFIQPKVNRLFS